MLTALAFLQTGPDALACVEGQLHPVAYPTAGSPAFLAPDFSLSIEHPWWFVPGGAPLRTLTRTEWSEQFPPVAGSRVRPAWQSADEARFARGFRALQGYLASGQLRKGVPVSVITADVGGEEAARVFRQALACVPALPASLMAYGFYQPPQGDRGLEFLIGATPELLFELDEPTRLLTMAVAGTRPTAAGPAGLEASPKERDEHQSVVEDLLAQLGEWGQPVASTTEVRSFGRLQHLVAEIRLDAACALDFETVARKLHPTPALGVYPRTPVGARWLEGIDPRRERGRFGAPFGLRLPSGGGRCLVAIRNLQYRDGRLEIWAGCGVVPQSRYEDEWEEILHKVETVRALWEV
ncbi:MAG TPA: chorismate-binding protein [Vicinamibacterales bacterium]|jgi:menaquinone-specific isochorismate synthase